MLRVVLNAWVTKTTAAEILANPATRTRQATMTISLNPPRKRRWFPGFHGADRERRDPDLPIGKLGHYRILAAVEKWQS